MTGSLGHQLSDLIAASELEGDPSFMSGPSTVNAIAVASAIQNLVPIRMSEGDERLRWYDDGVYREEGDAVARYLAQRLLASKANTARVNEVVAYVERTEAVRPLTIEPDGTDIIRARNGILNIRDWTLSPYTPETATVVQIPWELRNANCPRIHQFFLEIFEGDEATVKLVYEIAGYLCLSRNTLRKAILLYGSGGNGKSILLHLLKCLLGAKNVATVPLQRLGGDDRFAPSALLGKLANICGDVGPKSARDMSLFKQITGGDPIYAERKGRDGFSFLSGAVPVFSANEFPRSPDTSRAYIERWIVIEPTAIFADDHQKEAALRALGSDPDEMAGFFLQAAHAVQGVIKRGDFSYTPIVKDATARYARGIDSVRSWLYDECQRASGDNDGYELHKTMAYIAYKAYCEENHFGAVGRNKFYERVKNAGFRDGKSNGQHVFYGVRRTPQDEPEDATAADWDTERRKVTA